MRLQLLSDLHLETEDFQARPAPGAELLVLAGDIDSTWAGLSQFAHWPVPVIFVAGNHEFDRRELSDAWPLLRKHCESLGITLLEKQSCLFTSRAGLRVRFLCTTRWCDFDAFGPAHRAKAQRAASYFVKVMQATQNGQVFNPAAVREEALRCKNWLSAGLNQVSTGWDRTVVVTHYAPSLQSADPRYGLQPTSASFCNADDDLLPLADLWLHGHLHCRQDYAVDHNGHQTRVVCNARGHGSKGEAFDYNGLRLVEVF
ncbi:MAG: metallophosphoesterase [Burkholderiales bacterium]